MTSINVKNHTRTKPLRDSSPGHAKNTSLIATESAFSNGSLPLLNITTHSRPPFKVPKVAKPLTKNDSQKQIIHKKRAKTKLK